jgi:hypothetical protein
MVAKLARITTHNTTQHTTTNMSHCRCHPTLQRLSPISPSVWQRRPQILVSCLPHECAQGESHLVCTPPFLFPLFGAPKCNPSNNREGWCALVLGGRHFNDTHNNQMKDGFYFTVDVGEDTLPKRSMWGDVVSSLGAAN